jgi:glyoxylase-like metal-dependent hydrolase (beta-lactamase superfamily II)
MVAAHSSRRDALRLLLAATPGLGLSWPALLRAGQNASPAAPPISITQLDERLVMLGGAGGNMALLVSGAGLLMIDSGLANRSSTLLQTIAGVDKRSVSVLFNTHYHFDHVGANEAMGAAGAKIIAHENVKTRLGMKIVSEAMNATFEPLGAAGIPSQTFTTDGSMTFGADRVQYRHVPAAHTDGDSFLFLPDLNVLHTGDLFWNGSYPVIDYSAGGWIGGMISALDKLLGVGDEKTRVIPGHGPLATKNDIMASRDMLRTVQTRLAEAATKKQSLEQVQASAPTKDLDPQWARGRPPTNFVRQAYNGLLLKN